MGPNYFFLLSCCQPVAFKIADKLGFIPVCRDSKRALFGFESDDNINMCAHSLAIRHATDLLDQGKSVLFIIDHNVDDDHIPAWKYMMQELKKRYPLTVVGDLWLHHDIGPNIELDASNCDIDKCFDSIYEKVTKRKEEATTEHYLNIVRRS